MNSQKDFDSSWLDYVNSLYVRYDPDLIDKVHKLWDIIKKKVGIYACIPTSAGIVDYDDEAFQLCWDTDKYHLDIELFSNGKYWWFYKNRINNEYDGNEEKDGPEIMNNLLNYLEKIMIVPIF